MPEGLDEDKYLLIYRKQQQCIRYHIDKVLKDTGGSTRNPEVQRKQQQMFEQVMKRRPEFQQKAFELYGCKKQAGDSRSLEFLMRQAYLDFYSKSLQPENSSGVVYSKRMQTEQRTHNSRLESLINGHGKPEFT
jgi:hypothetical protein